MGAETIDERLKWLSVSRMGRLVIVFNVRLSLMEIKNGLFFSNPRS